MEENRYKNLNFKERVYYLSKRIGIAPASDAKYPGAIAKELLKRGLIECQETIEEKSYFLNKWNKNIKRDLEAGLPGSCERLDLYCRLFGCSADYLMGYIDRPLPEEKTLEEMTGLDANSVKALLKKDLTIIEALYVLISDFGSDEHGTTTGIKRALLDDLIVYISYSTRINKISVINDTEDEEQELNLKKMGFPEVCITTDHMSLVTNEDFFSSMFLMNIQKELISLRNINMDKGFK